MKKCFASRCKTLLFNIEECINVRLNYLNSILAQKFQNTFISFFFNLELRFCFDNVSIIFISDLLPSLSWLRLIIGVIAPEDSKLILNSSAKTKLRKRFDLNSQNWNHRITVPKNPKGNWLNMNWKSRTVWTKKQNFAFIFFIFCFWGQIGFICK